MLSANNVVSSVRAPLNYLQCLKKGFPAAVGKLEHRRPAVGHPREHQMGADLEGGREGGTPSSFLSILLLTQRSILGVSRGVGKTVLGKGRKGAHRRGELKSECKHFMGVTDIWTLLSGGVTGWRSS